MDVISLFTYSIIYEYMDFKLINKIIIKIIILYTYLLYIFLLLSSISLNYYIKMFINNNLKRN